MHVIIRYYIVYNPLFTQTQFISFSNGSKVVFFIETEFLKQNNYILEFFA